MDTTAPAHNLREMPWIGVRYLDGSRVSVGLDRLFRDAHLIRSLAVDSAAQRAGILRFLISATALIARKHDAQTDWEDVGELGFDETAAARSLAAVADHLWLRHPETPFMQDPHISDDAPLLPISSLAPMAPGGTAKTWWGRPGDGFTRSTLSPAEATATLAAAWFYSPAGAGRPPKVSYSDGPVIGWKGRGTLRPGTQGIRAFWAGDNLAQTLLANVMEDWVTDTSLPLWATSGRTTPDAGGLTSATWTGTTYRLQADGELFTGYRMAGRRVPGMDTPDKDTLTAMEESVFRADPTVMLEAVPVEKGKPHSGKTRTVKALAAGTTGMEYLTSWWLRDAATGRGAIPARTGLIDVERAENLIVRIEGEATSPELTEVSWLNVDDRLRDRHRDVVLIGLAGELGYHSRHLRLAVRDAFDDTVADTIAPRFGFSRANHALARHLETTLDGIIRIRERGPLTESETRSIARAVLSAFDEAVAPFTTPRTIEKIASSRNSLARRAYTSPAATRQKEPTS